MLKASELRIGNIIQVSDKITPVYHLEGGHINFRLPELFSGIPITEEWLLKAGFEKKPNEWYTMIYFTDCKEAVEKFFISYNLSSGRFALIPDEEDCAYPVYTIKSVEFLHQFQNLYYAITSEELKFNV